MKLSIHALVPLLTLLHSILFGLLLWRRGRDEGRYSDFIFAFLLILIGLSGVPFMLGWFGQNFLWEKWTFLPWDGLNWLIFPTVYCALKALTNDQWRFRWATDKYHVLPYGIYFTYHLILGSYGLFDRDFILFWWQKETDLGIFLLIDVLSYVQSVVYLVLSWRLYRAYQSWTEDQFSDTTTVAFGWFRNFLLMFTLTIAAGIVNEIYLRSVAFGYDLMLLSYGADLIMAYYVGVAVWGQVRAKSVRFEAVAASDTEGGPSPTVSHIDTPKNTAPEIDLEAWKKRILIYFEEKKPYFNPDLTLSDLSEQLKTNTSVLSWVINTGFEKNFNDFVNSYRVAAFQEALRHTRNSHLTLLAIAFDCGFNSKTTFNRAFKKCVGQSPSDYLAQQTQP